ncbi:MAG TPA: alpha-1,4-glucan--maltose-1-phosphate maltosyltransferase [Gemmataceae bacterium]|jgi:starch synthase (maltosyl-transferring)
MKANGRRQPAGGGCNQPANAGRSPLLAFHLPILGLNQAQRAARWRGYFVMIREAMHRLPDRLPSRVVIEGVEPEIDGGQFPIKRSIGEEVVVGADVYADGHDALTAVLHYRHASEKEWKEVPMEPHPNDRWTGRFTVTALGVYEYTLQAWIDRFASWRRDLAKKVEAQQEVTSELLEGAELVSQSAKGARAEDGEWLRWWADSITKGSDMTARTNAALDPVLSTIMSRYADRDSGLTYPRILRVTVDRERARYGAWYELFPRSCADEPGRHGTFKDVEKRLPYVRDMGFDVLYLPPIHPIGHSFRKGRNNSLTAGPDDPGSPWGIGAAEGGHTGIHPQLGTLAEFEHLLAAASEHNLEVAIDIAFQCSPDHPWVREHPEWFRHRPDGTIKYAENPPKKYQDIYPIDFECADWQGLWQALREVMFFWCEHGVRIFRVDNPHTKPFRFWEWLIAEIQPRYPDTIFLSEAFTRPKVMRHLAKLGFSQSYTYFTWRNNKHELTEYFTELTQTAVREYMRPNLFANTPDILPEFLQYGGRTAFHIRFVLAATLGASYGIYGPSFETFQPQAVKTGSEEYLDSEKYQIRHWDWDRPNVFRELIARVNAIRRENPALHTNDRLHFYQTDNEQILFYGKSTADMSNVIFVVVNLDPHHVQSGWVRVPLAELELKSDETYQVHDLLTEARYLWSGEWNFVRLDPNAAIAHILRVRKRVRTEKDFDYFY